MKAVILTKTCSADELTLQEVAIPQVHPGWVLIRVRAFGINHSEVLLRRYEADAPYIRLPRIPGIECVGEIADASDSAFVCGQRVVALMGGMGRSFDGSYAEYTVAPTSHVFAVDNTWEWSRLAAVPESFYTAYGSLVQSLQLHEHDSLLVRGATSTVGLAAVQLAHAMDANVIATTRNPMRVELLQRVGANHVVVDDDTFRHNVKQIAPKGVDKVLELVGPLTLRESLQLVCRQGIVCQTGLLGGSYRLDAFDPIKEIPSGVYLTGFYSNTPTSQVMHQLFELLNHAAIEPVIAQIFRFDQIAEAHRLAESRTTCGKIVVVME
jgi:NADPH:quinone reductase-like Zn-dependent oxidoreductase